MRRLVVTAFLFALGLASFSGPAPAQEEKDTPKAAATRKLLKTKISVEYKDTPLREVVSDVKDQIHDKTKKTLSVLIDTKGGVSLNTKFTYKADDKTLEAILDELFSKNDLGYVVIQRGAYPGALQIVKGKARGYPPKKE